MKHRIPYTIILLAAAFLCVNCNSVYTGSDSPGTKMSASPSALEFDGAAGTAQLIITCGEELSSIVSNASWCTVSAGKFTGSSVTVDVTVEENAASQSRTAYITAKCGGQTLSVKVTQDIKQIPIEVSKTEFSAECYGLYDGSFTVSSTTTPQVSSNVSWCTFQTVTLSSGNKTEVKVYIGANRTEHARSGDLTVTCGKQTASIKLTQKAYSVQTATTTALTPEMVFDAFRMGWNMGNHMDAYSNDVASETAWGSPKCTQATVDGVKAAGFSSIRIPVTWMGRIGEGGAYKIEDSWMNRVAEIVEYAHKAGLKVIINTHHDENNNESSAHWLDIKNASTNSTLNESIKDEIFCVWCQIALKFKDCGEWLCFEPFNELQDGGWGWSSTFRSNPKPQYKVLNEWNQVFVDAVRCTGGENATRWLSTVGYAQSSSTISINGLEIPKDYTTANRLMVGFHDYDPYNYTLSDPMKEQWGHTADPAKRCSDTDEQNVIDTFELFKSTYADKGIPMYIGEMGCSFHSGDDFLFQKYYIEYFCKAAADRGIPMFVWDNGNAGWGSEHHAYIDHGTGDYASAYAKEVIDLMIKAVNDNSADYTLQSVWDSAPVL